MALQEKECKPCDGRVFLLKKTECELLLKELPEWKIENEKLMRAYRLSDFKQAMQLANRIAEIAEAEKHHPDLLVRWGELQIQLWTHALNGLTENDFILAAKIEHMVRSKIS